VQPFGNDFEASAVYKALLKGQFAERAAHILETRELGERRLLVAVFITVIFIS
jgi:hypothetical protein